MALCQAVNTTISDPGGELKKTSIRLPMELWDAVQDRLNELRMRREFGSLIVRLLEEWLERTKDEVAPDRRARRS